MASESIAHKAEGRAIDSEPIRARWIIVNRTRIVNVYENSMKSINYCHRWPKLKI